VGSDGVRVGQSGASPAAGRRPPAACAGGLCQAAHVWWGGAEWRSLVGMDG
jgi:hypothetical protein